MVMTITVFFSNPVHACVKINSILNIEIAVNVLTAKCSVLKDQSILQFM